MSEALDIGPDELRLEAEGIYLRHPRASDWAQWAELREASRDFLQPWEPAWADDGLTEAFYTERIGEVEELRQRGECLMFFIFRSEDDRLLGGITLSNIRRAAAQTGTIGYWMGAEHANRGHMTRALRRVIDHAFETLKLHRLEASIVPGNEISYRLLLRAGFRKEGIARGQLHINGAWRDHMTFAMLWRDWQEMRKR